MKKRFLLTITLLFTVLLVFTGCTKKTAITSDEFKKHAESEGYTITDTKNQFSSYNYIKEAYAATSTDGYQIEFYILSDSDYAKGMYTTNKAIIENINGTNKLNTEVNLKNYSKYVVTTSNKYGVVSRIDNTLIYVNTDVTNKEKVNNFIKKLKY